MWSSIKRNIWLEADSFDQDLLSQEARTFGSLDEIIFGVDSIQGDDKAGESQSGLGLIYYAVGDINLLVYLWIFATDQDTGKISFKDGLRTKLGEISLLLLLSHGSDSVEGASSLKYFG